MEKSFFEKIRWFKNQEGEEVFTFFWNQYIFGKIFPAHEKAFWKYCKEKGVKTIAESAFYNCTDMKSITIPSFIQNIESLAFSGCENLKRVVLPSSLKTLKQGAFFNCRQLTEIVWKGKTYNLTNKQCNYYLNSIDTLKRLESEMSDIDKTAEGIMKNCDPAIIKLLVSLDSRKFDILNYKLQQFTENEESAEENSELK